MWTFGIPRRSRMDTRAGRSAPWRHGGSRVYCRLHPRHRLSTPLRHDVVGRIAPGAESCRRRGSASNVSPLVFVLVIGTGIVAALLRHGHDLAGLPAGGLLPTLTTLRARYEIGVRLRRGRTCGHKDGLDAVDPARPCGAFAGSVHLWSSSPWASTSRRRSHARMNSR